jgi:exodeoxyribonuclease VII large subunit
LLSSTSPLSKERILTVSQLTLAIKDQLESQFSSLWIQGEVSNFTKHSSGHLYFSLKDAQAQLSAVMFRGSTTSLSTLPKTGDHVMVRGELTVYPPRGQYQLVVRELHFVGLGELLIKLEKLKQELAQRGYFRPERKRFLPKFPQRIGVITSPTGAAIQDILNILNRRHAGFRLLLNPVKVQGEGAAQEIAKSICQMNQYQLVDVIIVGRGGGSLEDLWAFNEEVVARAIYESALPIISAVGHETDVTIADLVADIRAPTPSAAAEIVIAEKAQQLAFLAQLHRRLLQTVTHLIARARQQLKRFQTHPLIALPYQLLGPRLQKFDDMRDTLDQSILSQLKASQIRLTHLQRQAFALRPSAKIAHFKLHLMRLKAALDQSAKLFLTLRKERLSALMEHLGAIDPKQVLLKGYSILFEEKTGRVITSLQQLHSESTIRALVADGEALLSLSQVTKKEIESNP